MFSSSFSSSSVDFLTSLDESHQSLPCLHWDSLSLSVPDVLKAVHFYEKVYGFQRLFMLTDDHGTVAFARMRYRGTYFTISHDGDQSSDDLTSCHAESYTKPPFYLYVDYVDSVFARAVVNGCYALESPHRDFFDEYKATLLDIFGYTWVIAAKI